MAILIRSKRLNKQYGLNITSVWNPWLDGNLEQFVVHKDFTVTNSDTNKKVRLHEAIELDKEFIKEENERKEKQGR